MVATNSAQTEPAACDVFLSHAWEDKAALARPLHHRLCSVGIGAWLDENELEHGDPLQDRIDPMLLSCTCAVVIVSPRLLAKHWTVRELETLLEAESRDGRLRILPIWHGVDPEYVRPRYPSVADRLGPTSLSLDDVVSAVERFLARPVTPSLELGLAHEIIGHPETLLRFSEVLHDDIRQRRTHPIAISSRCLFYSPTELVSAATALRQPSAHVERVQIYVRESIAVFGAAIRDGIAARDFQFYLADPDDVMEFVEGLHALLFRTLTTPVLAPSNQHDPFVPTRRKDSWHVWLKERPATEFRFLRHERDQSAADHYAENNRIPFLDDIGYPLEWLSNQSLRGSVLPRVAIAAQGQPTCLETDSWCFSVRPQSRVRGVWSPGRE
jgi:hypothetical protein